MDKGNWSVIETAFDPQRLHHKETVFTLGNGYLSTRGAFEEGYPGAWPATLVHGVYDDVPIVYTELANCPDWPSLSISLDGQRFRMDRGQVLAYRRQLDLQEGVLTREVRWRSPSGHVVDLCFERFASLADPHVLAVRLRVTPLESTCEVKIQAGINGHPDNMGTMHWQWIDQGADGDMVWLHLSTRHSGIDLGMATRLVVSGAQQIQPLPMDCPNCPTLAATYLARPEQTVTATKFVSLFTSRDTSEPGLAACEQVASLNDYTKLLDAHRAAWAEVWDACDVVIEGDPTAQLALRYSLFQALIAAPRTDDRVSISAKTLSGFGYRGHVFWDTEIFMLPLFTYTQPAIARNLLTYRYHTLPGARRKARQNGYQGAMFAWESADTGDEVTPRFVPGPQGEGLVRIWCGDIELHITCDVAYATWNYWQATGDDAWMRCHGAELLLDTAVFWGSRAEWNADQPRYEISDVIGPDEYHEHVDNNAFTNRMVQWHLRVAAQALDWLRQADPERASELCHRLDLTAQRLAHWEDICQKIAVLEDPGSGLIEQFQGFFDLQDVDLREYEPRDRSMQAVLGIEGANRHQVLKQADVLMLLYLLRDQYPLQTIQRNWDYYAPRTDHTYGSSLSPAIHATVASMLNRPAEAYEHFMRAALADLQDTRGNAGDGIHAASTGGLWQAVVFGFAGLSFTEAGPVASPHLPPGWTRLRFRLWHRGQQYAFDLEPSLPSQPEPAPSDRPNIRAVIFDLDGVLTDTSEHHYLGWQKLADEEGIPFDRQANEALRGVSRRDSLLILLGERQVTEAQLEEMMDRKNRYYQASIQGITPDNLLPGALCLLDELRRAGIKIAIGSASKNARTVIARLGLEQYVDAVSDGYSVERHKPAPDLFLHAAAQLGVAAEQCVVVEDATSGIEAARAAGMWSVGLGPVDRVGQAHVVLASLEGVHWSELADRLAEARAK